MKGSDFLQKLLRTYDINRIFGVLGREAASITFTEEHSQDFFLVRNELTAGMAAISASRLTGKPQVCFSTLGPGVTHMATAIGSACQDRNPVLFFSAQLETPATDYNNAHQCIDAVSVTRPITKFASEPTNLEQLAVAIDRAFSKMMQYPLGPAFISLPIDLLDMTASDTLVAKWLSVNQRSIATTSMNTSHAITEDAISKSIQLLNKSRNPIIIIGDTMTKSPDTVAIKKLVEQLNIPVITTYSAKGILPFGHPLYLGSINSYLDVILESFIQKDIFESVDTILLLGYDMTEHYPNAWNHGDNKKIININYFDNETNKSFISDIKIIGNITEILQKIVKRTKPRTSINENMILVQSKIIEALNRFMIERSHRGGISIPQIIQAINATAEAPYDYIVANDIGTHRHVTATFFAPKLPHYYLTSAGFSSYGTGIGLAIGAAISQPKKRTFLITGDGGFHSNSGDLETIVRNKLPITIIVANNNSNGLIKRYQLTGRERRQDLSTTEFMQVDFVKLAEANGMQGQRAATPTRLSKILTSRDYKQPLLIEVPVYYPDLYINQYAKSWNGEKTIIL